MKPSDIERFNSYVIKGKNCWEWAAAKDPNGYGRFWWGRQMRLAHHIAYFIKFGVEDGLYLMHSCDNPSCVNPDHLSKGSHEENMRDMSDKGRSGQRKVDPHAAKRLRDEGMTFQAIADLHGVSQQAVIQGIKRHYGK